MIRLISVACLALTCGLAQANTIRIALVGPFSGAYAAYGNQLLTGASQAVNDLNLKWEPHGVKLEIIPIDDQCSPDLAIYQAEKIIAGQQYQAVIGHVCSAATLAAANSYAKANILLITPTATNPKITQRHLSTVFRMTGTDEQQSLAAAKFIANNLRSKRIAILHDDELYSKDLANLVSEQLVQLEKTPVLHQEIHRGKSNFTNLVNKLKNLQVDAVYFAGLYPEVSSLAKTLDSLQLQIPLITADGIALQKFVAATGDIKIAKSVLMTFGDDPKQMLSCQKTIQNMTKNKFESTGYALYAYAAVQTISQAFEKCNTTQGNTLAAWLHQHEVETVLGKKSWDSNGDIINSNFHIYSWSGIDKTDAIELKKIS